MFYGSYFFPSFSSAPPHQLGQQKISIFCVSLCLYYTLTARATAQFTICLFFECGKNAISDKSLEKMHKMQSSVQQQPEIERKLKNLRKALDGAGTLQKKRAHRDQILIFCTIDRIIVNYTPECASRRGIGKLNIIRNDLFAACQSEDGDRSYLELIELARFSAVWNISVGFDQIWTFEFQQVISSLSVRLAAAFIVCSCCVLSSIHFLSSYRIRTQNSKCVENIVVQSQS